MKRQPNHIVNVILVQHPFNLSCEMVYTTSRASMPIKSCLRSKSPNRQQQKSVRFDLTAILWDEPAISHLNFEIDYQTLGATSTFHPHTLLPPRKNIHLESIALHKSSLTGTILVLNVSYEKDVAVRYTLDDWQTVSEVRAQYGGRGYDGSNMDQRNWDRFKFIIPLDHAQKLPERALWLVGRYTALGECGGEWWDNNSGLNYRVGFKELRQDSRSRTSFTALPWHPIKFRGSVYNRLLEKYCFA